MYHPIYKKLQCTQEMVEWIGDRHVFLSGNYPCIKECGVDRFLHHVVLPKRDGYDVDHKDRDKWNCLPDNLRYVTRSVNSLNKTMPPNKAGVKGITKIKGRIGFKYKARLTVDGVVYSRPTRYTLEDAQTDRIELEELYLPPELEPGI